MTDKPVNKYIPFSKQTGWTNFSGKQKALLFNPGNRIRRRYMLNLLKNHTPRQPSLILDLGAGLGDFACEFFMQKHTYDHIYYILCDIEKDAMVEASKSLKGFSCDFVLADAQNLPIKSEIFDLVICAEVLEHLPDDFSAINEIRRVLRKKAVAVISIPIHSRKDKGELRTYNINAFKKLCIDASLSIDSILLCCRTINFINKIFRYLFNREGMGEKESYLYSRIPIIPKIFSLILTPLDHLLSKKQPSNSDQGTLVTCIRRYD